LSDHYIDARLSHFHASASPPPAFFAAFAAFTIRCLLPLMLLLIAFAFSLLLTLIWFRAAFAG
jgi:hypothetical protein